MAKRRTGTNRRKGKGKGKDRTSGEEDRAETEGWRRRHAAEQRTRVVIFVLVICVSVFLYGFYVTYMKDKGGAGSGDDDGGDGGDGPDVDVPPAAKATASPSTIKTFDEVTFDGSGSKPQGEIEEFTWHIYKIWLNGPYIEAIHGRVSKYKFNESGTYYIYLVIRTMDGRTATSLDDDRYAGGKNEYAGIIIDVKNRDPLMFAQASSPDDPDLGPTVIAQPNMTVTFDATGSFDEDGSLVKYEWNFGDSLAILEGANVTHVYTAEGVYNAVCKGIDDDQGYSYGNVTVYIRK